MPRLNEIVAKPAVLARRAREIALRERQRLIAEILQVRGLMPLLMKPRNRQRWTPEDKRELVAHLKRFSSISPYLVVLAMPGGMLMLPALAWWLDRRRNGRREADASRR